jgi:predicted DNA-binding transcriptional regulator AlpA
MTANIIRLPAVRERTGLPSSTIYHYIKLGIFPASVALGGGRSVGWYSDLIDSWVQTRQSVNKSPIIIKKKKGR